MLMSGTARNLFAAKKTYGGITVNWGTWQGHVEVDWLAKFRKEFDAKVNPIGITDNAENFMKTKLGGSKMFDIMQADGEWCRKFYDTGLIEPVDIKRMPRADKYISKEYRDERFKVGDKYLQINWGWAPHILAYNKKYVDPPPTSWEVMWDPKYKGKVICYGSTRALYVVAYVLRFPPWDMNKDQLREATKKLIELKRNLLKFNIETQEVQRLLREESAWIALCVSPGRALKVSRAGGPPIGVCYPEEGYYGFVDGDMFIKGSSNREAAFELVNFIHQPEYVAQNMKRVPRAPCNWGGVELLKKMGEEQLIKEYAMDRPDIFHKMDLDRAPSDMEGYTNAWNEVLAG